MKQLRDLLEKKRQTQGVQDKEEEKEDEKDDSDSGKLVIEAKTEPMDNYETKTE